MTAGVPIDKTRVEQIEREKSAKSIEFTAPITIVSESNRSMGRHWAVVRRRFQSHARDIALCLKNAETKTNARVWNWPMDAQPIVVTLTRIAPRRLDSHDNLRSGFKGCVDQIAHEVTCQRCLKTREFYGSTFARDVCKCGETRSARRHYERAYEGYYHPFDLREEAPLIDPNWPGASQ